MKQTMLRKEIGQAMSGDNVFFTECGGGKSTCSLGGILHRSCVAKYPVKFGVIDGTTYCMWCLKERENPKPVKMRTKPKPPTLEVEAMPVKDEESLLQKANELIKRNFPTYVPADMPSQIQKDLDAKKLVPINLQDLEIEDTIVNDHEYENVSEDEEENDSIGLRDDDSTSGPSSQSLGNLAERISNVELHDVDEVSTHTDTSSLALEPEDIDFFTEANLNTSLTEHTSPPSQDMTD